MGEVLKFMTPYGGLRKKNLKIFAFFAKITQFKNIFRLNFGLKRPSFEQCKTCSNYHKKELEGTS